MSNGPDDYCHVLLVHIIENAILPDPELPHGLDMLPGRNQAHKDLAIASAPGWFMPQLCFDPIQYLGALAPTDTAQIIRNTF